MVDWRKDACKTMWLMRAKSPIAPPRKSGFLHRRNRTKIVIIIRGEPATELFLRHHNKKRTQNARGTYVSQSWSLDFGTNITRNTRKELTYATTR